jgi:hypothetical protein
MRPVRTPAVALLVASLSLAPSALAQQNPEKVDMAAMMAKAKKYTQPGEEHKLLHRFLGSWDTEVRMTMPGTSNAPEKGTATCRWLMEGRWLQCDGSGTMMGMAMKTTFILGYNIFKMSYVSAAINSVDTIMIYSEGDLDPAGKALLMYGTLDEYLTGEHDKMVKSVWRFVSDDEMKLEIHDLPIGESNTQVFEIRYRRHKEG